MELLLSKKSSTLKKGTSLSFLFHSQKPTFTRLPEGPTRYYDFVDTPDIFRPSSVVDRQTISRKVEAEIRDSCLLLVHRVGQGVPSRATKSMNSRLEKSTVTSEEGLSATKPQIESQYTKPNVGPEAAALAGIHDSGVGLTQQPSRQTMRVLQSSQSDKPSDLGAKVNTAVNQERCATSCSAPLDTKSTERRSSFPSVSSPKQPEMESLAGVATIGHPQPPDQDTKNFLADESQSPSLDTTADGSDDMEVFLNPDATLMATGVASFSSPETLLNLSSPDGRASDFQPSRWSQSTTSCTTQADHPPVIGLGTTAVKDTEHQAGIIIDTNGNMHVMSAEEESQRNMHLQQAVMAKMKAGRDVDPVHPAARPIESKRPDTSSQRPQSRLHSAWSSKTRGTLSKWRSRFDEPQSDKTATPGFFQKIATLFGKRRAQAV
ncbi:hypothetical protein P170DRAFT_74171 [Aspergillus steynii IBT 23096]|uniref:Uncharacterized protein n=1 Tax=Aspergillus steynii IBT 23096 TaxID=1392250 RepID=A0A2I2FRH4_9EURO|nr:uncharacterized protein P170DRAFT_74171 [Aspergillus steynii IBT 23096]PLB43211.1 hypothetical protein P170DRAFT_74171 [Aspergillus steynii IBT 23096]